jgi:hypothetical protein
MKESHSIVLFSHTTPRKVSSPLYRFTIIFGMGMMWFQYAINTVTKKKNAYMAISKSRLQSLLIFDLIPIKRIV